MSFSIQTNMNSLNAQQNMEVNNAFQSKTIQQLTSGYRINQSGDDAAGLAVANKFRSNIAELTQGVSNANDGVSQLQIMDGGVNNIGIMLDRLKTLAAQSASSTFTGDRSQLNAEFQTDVQEIDRQAQSIGLNTNGSFAKNLAVYIGVGSGSTSLDNGTVNVDLSKSTVDTQSLGLAGVQALNSNAYNLSAASATSVQNIVTNGVNTAGLVPANTTQFTFHGAGFADDTSTTNLGVSISVDVSGVSDTNSLVTQINAAIQTAGNGSTGAAAAFKAAGITASIVTDSSGNQKLAFSSSNSAFTVQAADRLSSALLGNFSTGSTGAKMGTTQTSRANIAAIAAPGLNFSGGNGVTLTFAGAGLSSPVTVKLVTDDSASGAAVVDINKQLVAAGAGGIVASGANAASLVFTSATAGAFSVTTNGATAGITALGLIDSGSTAGVTTGGAVAATTYNTYNANGGSQLGTSGIASALQWGTLAGTSGDTQAITVSANDASGAAHQQTVNLLSNGSTGSLDVLSAAVVALNQGLQQSNDSTLQQITAVAVNDNGVAKINFVSNLKNFGVSVGNATAALNTLAANANTQGLYHLNSSNAIAQGFNVQSTQVGSGGTADISSATGALTALTAISQAVNTLGTAQAAIGKGQNVFNYAISLAQSQITNFSSAQSQIRDADVAMEAANLTKAQVLQQASIAAMAQANSAPQALLKLLG